MKKRGIGYACMFYGTGYGNGFPDESRADVKLCSDGTFELYAAAGEVGQGAKSVMLQIACEALQTEPSNISVINNNTLNLKDSGTAAASRQTYNTGNAVKIACEKLKQNIISAVSDYNGENDELKNAYKIMLDKNISAEESGYFKASTSAVNMEDGQGEPYWPYTFAVQKAAVEVDDETGKVDVLDITVCQDVGKAVNPSLVEGQIEGGCAMGVGYGIMEKVEFEKGNIKNKNFSDYIIPTSMDVPQIKVYLIEEEEKSGPYGAKGVGEPSMIPTAPAVLNAIYDAVGVRITDLPATEEKIIEGLKEMRERRGKSED